MFIKSTRTNILAVISLSFLFSGPLASQDAHTKGTERFNTVMIAKGWPSNWVDTKDSLHAMWEGFSNDGFMALNTIFIHMGSGAGDPIDADTIIGYLQDIHDEVNDEEDLEDDLDRMMRVMIGSFYLLSENEYFVDIDSSGGERTYNDVANTDSIEAFVKAIINAEINTFDYPIIEGWVIGGEPFGSKCGSNLWGNRYDKEAWEAIFDAIRNAENSTNLHTFLADYPEACIIGSDGKRHHKIIYGSGCSPYWVAQPTNSCTLQYYIDGVLHEFEGTNDIFSFWKADGVYLHDYRTDHKKEPGNYYMQRFTAGLKQARRDIKDSDLLNELIASVGTIHNEDYHTTDYPDHNDMHSIIRNAMKANPDGLSAWGWDYIDAIKYDPASENWRVGRKDAEVIENEVEGTDQLIIAYADNNLDHSRLVLYHQVSPDLDGWNKIYDKTSTDQHFTALTTGDYQLYIPSRGAKYPNGDDELISAITNSAESAFSVYRRNPPMNCQGWCESTLGSEIMSGTLYGLVTAMTSGDFGGDAADEKVEGADELILVYFNHPNNRTRIDLFERVDPYVVDHTCVFDKSNTQAVTAVTAGDYDGDGKDVLVIARYYSGSSGYRLYLKDDPYDGATTSWGNYLSGSSSYWKVTALTSGDFDGDGDDELVYALTNSSLQKIYMRLAENVTTSGLSGLRTVHYQSGDEHVSALTAGDYDGDGKDELIIATTNADNEGYKIYRRDNPQEGSGLGTKIGDSDPSIYWHLVALASGDFNLSEPSEYGPFQKSLADLLAEAPTEFALGHNYPNPFNTRTTIAYELPQESKVSLVIYDVMGRKVRKLVDAHQNSGQYWVIWDGTNEKGRQVSTGLYLYRIVAGDYVKIRKMLLLK